MSPISPLPYHLSSNRNFSKCNELTHCSIPKELEVDAREFIGTEMVDFRIIEGGHEFPITKADEIVEQLSVVWGL